MYSWCNGYYWWFIVTSFVIAMVMEAPKRAITMSCFIVNYIFVTSLKLSLCRISQLSPLCDMSLKSFHNCYFSGSLWTHCTVLFQHSFMCFLVDWLMHLLLLTLHTTQFIQLISSAPPFLCIGNMHLMHLSLQISPLIYNTMEGQDCHELLVTHTYSHIVDPR